jgi:hypothetical protein
MVRTGSSGVGRANEPECGEVAATAWKAHSWDGLEGEGTGGTGTIGLREHFGPEHGSTGLRCSDWSPVASAPETAST